MSRDNNRSNMATAPTIALPEPGWSDDQWDAFRVVLRAAMPRDSFILDLWDWDVHFEDGDSLSDDWLVAAAFGSDESLDQCAEELAELFLRMANEYGMDYDQWADPDEFGDRVLDGACQFIGTWRKALRGAA